MNYQFCLENSEFTCQNTGIFSNELELGWKNARILLFLYITNNQRLIILRHLKSNQKSLFSHKKGRFLPFITYIVSTRNIHSYAHNIYSYDYNDTS